MGTPPWEKTSYGKSTLPQRVPRESFVYDIMKQFDLEGLFDLEFETFQEIVDDDPKGAALLINDLVRHIFETRYEGDV
jgi:hypothetical protein